MLVTPLNVHGGGARQALKLARELKAQGHDPTLITPALDAQRCYPDLIEGLDIRVSAPGRALRRLAWIGGRLDLDTVRRAPILACADLVTSEFEVINCHDMTGSWPAARARVRTGIPAVWMCNDPPLWYHEVQQRRGWQQALERRGLSALDPERAWLEVVDRPAARIMDRIVVLDNKNVKRVRSIYGLDATVVRTGVDAAYFGAKRPPRAREELGLAGKFVILHVGYAAPWKGQHDAIRALKAIEADVPEAHVVCVGSSVRAFCAPLAASLGLTEKVTLLEGIPDGLLAALYAECDVLVYPANETWGLNVTEAMCAGKPTVVSDQTGVSEVIEDGTTGFVHPHGDIDALARALKALHASPELCRRVGEAGRAYAEANLTWGNYARALVAVFTQVLDSGGPSKARRGAGS